MGAKLAPSSAADLAAGTKRAERAPSGSGRREVKASEVAL